MRIQLVLLAACRRPVVVRGHAGEQFAYRFFGEADSGSGHSKMQVLVYNQVLGISVGVFISG